MPSRNDLLDCFIGLIIKLKSQPIELTPRQTKELIDRVHDYDELWCETSWMYQHRCCRLDAWSKICREMGIDMTTAMEKYRAVLLQGRCESTWSEKHPSYSIPPYGCKRCQRTPNPLSDCVVRALVVLEADIAFRKTAAAILRNRRRHSGAEHWNKAYKCRK